MITAAILHIYSAKHMAPNRKQSRYLSMDEWINCGTSSAPWNIIQPEEEMSYQATKDIERS